MTAEDDHHKPGIVSTCEAVEYGFTVEARDDSFSHTNPLTLVDGVVGPDWREMRFSVTTDVKAGMPMVTGQGQRFGLFPEASAKALAWALLAQNPAYRLEARLVPYKLNTNHCLERLEFPPDFEVIRRSIP